MNASADKARANKNTSIKFISTYPTMFADNNPGKFPVLQTRL